MKRAFAVVLVLALLASSFAFLPAFASILDYWTEKTPTPDAIGIGTAPANAAVLDGKIYTVAQGDMLEIYDPATDSWTNGTQMPIKAVDITTAACQNKIYVFSGIGGISCITEVYDPATGEWQTAASMPSSWVPMRLQANVVDGKIYLIGGLVQLVAYAFQFFSWNWMYDPANDSWSERASIPLGVAGYASCVVDGKIYVIGGAYNYVRGFTSYTDRVQVYDPETDGWSEGKPLPNAMAWMAASATVGVQVPKRIYVVGGVAEGDSGKFTVGWMQIYDLQAGERVWSRGSAMPAVRSGLVLVNVDDAFYAIGGEDANGNPVTANWAYTPDYSPTPQSPAAVVAVALIVSAAAVSFGLVAYFLRRKRRNQT
jgi:N-acetylneuraminic acid mutarotase